MLTERLYLYTAPVHSGKTTALMAWAEGRTDLGGFLAPDLDGVRHLLTLRDRRLHPFQVKDGADEAVVNICRYSFLASAFALAQATLRADAQRPTPWIVVDEVGKLELRGEGHEPVLGELIRMHQTGAYPGQLLLVVRSELLSEVVEKYKLNGAPVLSSPQELASLH